jgi:predicted transcriptional regulator
MSAIMKTTRELLERRVIQLLQQHGPQSCTQIGEQLFGGKRDRQAYARPAGKVLHSLRRKGLVEQTRQGCAEYHASNWRLSNTEVSDAGPVASNCNKSDPRRLLD